MDNKINTLKIIILAIGLLTGIASVYAQTNDSTKVTREVQVTFVHPLGSNGIDAPKVINNFSFNLLYGVSGGVQGAEIGGLINIGFGDVKGFQLAGLGNSATGSMDGFQAAGLYNFVQTQSNGAQFAGIANINLENTKGAYFGGITNIIKENSAGAYFAGIATITNENSNGAYFSGLTNITNGNSRSAQVSGLGNVNLGSMNGAQIAGLANLNIKELYGAQVSGLANVNLEEMNGAQIAGLANLNVKDITGIQIAGLANVAAAGSQSQIAGLGNVVAKESSGIQLAGLFNISPKEHRGSQIAGLFNYTRTLNGFQLATINISDTIKKGVPVGFISIVANGYRRFEFEGNEALFVNLSFKTGTEKFYNIFSIGYRPQGEKQHWGVTYGIGTLIPVSERVNINFDLTATQLNEDEAWTNTLNLLNRFKFNVSYRITRRLEVMGGPSFNVAVSRLQNAEGKVVGSSIVPSYGFYDETIRGTNVKMYIGFNAGMRF